MVELEALHESNRLLEGESYPATEQEEGKPSDIPSDPGTLQVVTASKPASALLFRKPYILILVLYYASIAVARSAILCILNIRPKPTTGIATHQLYSCITTPIPSY